MNKSILPQKYDFIPISALSNIKCDFVNERYGTIIYASVLRIPSLIQGKNGEYVWQFNIRGKIHLNNIYKKNYDIELIYGKIPQTTFEGEIIGIIIINNIIYSLNNGFSFIHNSDKNSLIFNISENMYNQIQIMNDINKAAEFLMKFEIQDTANCSGCSTTTNENDQGTTCYQFFGNAYASPCKGNSGNCCCQGSGNAACVNCSVSIPLGGEIGCSCTQCTIIPS
jgi:hypothetical protein